MKSFVIISLISQAAIASPTCDDLVKDCNAALQAQVQANQLQKLVINDYEQRKDLDDQRIQFLENENSAWYRSPWLWMFVGFATGAYLGIEARK